jgi:hypothetical protein
LLAVVLCIGVLAGYEATWRGFGFTPSINDDPATWAVARGSVRSDSVVFVGTSRIQADLDPAVWAESRAATPVQLAISGGSPVPVLEQLSRDSSFGGTVVFDVVPRIIFDAEETRERQVWRWLDSYNEARRSPARMSEARLRMPLTANVVSARLSPWQFFSRTFLRSDAYRIPYVTMGTDRFMQLDFNKTDMDERIDVIYRQIQKQGHPAVGVEIEETLQRIDKAVSTIRSRGGNVVLVHLPHDGKILDLETELYPRATYWDALVARVKAPAIHFADEPTLSAYRCPDGSHLDVRDTADFTRDLARVVRERLAHSSHRTAANE